MGKKKSVVLITLLTIVLVVLCAITAFPSFTLPFKNGTQKWSPAVMQFDLGMDLGGEYLDGRVGGGYYAYYYPDGVIPSTEYVAEEDEEYGYEAHGGLYLSKDPDKGVYLEDGTISPDFEETFEAALKTISARYAAKGYEDYRVAIVDDYAIRVEVPASQISHGYTSSKDNATTAISTFALTGELTLRQDSTVITELSEDQNEYTIKDVIKSIKVKTQYEISYLEIKFTSYGKTILDKYVTSDDTLSIAIGEQDMLSIDDDMVDGKTVKYSLAQDSDKHYAETICILLDSALNDGGFDIEFTVSDVRGFAPVYSNNSLYFVFGAILVVLAVLIVLAIVKMGGFGVVNGYCSLFYTTITVLCYAFISGGVFPVTMGTVLVFITGLVLINAISYYVYKAIKTEAQLGKTVDSAVKGGYKKTLMTIIDIHAVLLLGSVALLIGVGGLFTLAIQAFIAVLASAAMCLLLGRAFNYVFLSANKDKYKYFKFVREDDDDE